MQLKHSSNFWRTCEFLSIKSEISIKVTWSKKCIIPGNDAATFQATNAKLYVPLVTLSTKNNLKILRQLKIGFKRSVNWMIG